MLAGILRRVGRRLVASIPALLGVVVVTFTLMRVLPGDPAVYFSSGPSSGREEIEALRHSMGLDRPIPVQLLRYLGQVATGDLGQSLTTGQPVALDMRRRLPASLELTCTALLIALVLSVPLGVLAALRPGSAVDHAVRMLCTLGVCVPDLRLRAAADLCVLLPARLGAGPHGAHRHLRVRPAQPHRLLSSSTSRWCAIGTAGGRPSPSSCCQPSLWRYSCWRRWPA